jgi:hypothetical protein
VLWFLPLSLAACRNLICATLAPPCLHALAHALARRGKRGQLETSAMSTEVCVQRPGEGRGVFYSKLAASAWAKKSAFAGSLADHQRHHDGERVQRHERAAAVAQHRAEQFGRQGFAAAQANREPGGMRDDIRHGESSWPASLMPARRHIRPAPRRAAILPLRANRQPQNLDVPAATLTQEPAMFPRAKRVRARATAWRPAFGAVGMLRKITGNPGHSIGSIQRIESVERLALAFVDRVLENGAHFAIRKFAGDGHDAQHQTQGARQHFGVSEIALGA